jgi:multiple sugar transport system permease protein
MKYVARAFVFITAIVLLLPILWMFKTSFEGFGDSIRIPPNLIPIKPSVISYREIFLHPIVLWFANSILISAVAVGLCLVFTILAGYGFSRFKWKGREFVFWFMIASIIIPGQTTLIPLYLMIRRLGLYDNRWGVILPSIAAPFYIFFYRVYLKGLPDEFIEAARLDGAGIFTEIFRVVAPLTVPALSTIGILGFLGQWKNFLWQLVILQNENKKTVVVGIAQVIEEIALGNQVRAFIDMEIGRGFHYNSVCAGAMVSFVPLFIVFILAQRRFIRSIYAGGLE